MEADQTQVSSQSQSKFQNCLLVTRHQLLKTQEDDLARICVNITKVDSLPTTPVELGNAVSNYDAVVGVLPLPLQVQILQQAKKKVLSFYMESIGTMKTKEEAQDLLAKSGEEGVILPPAKEGESYRVLVYRGIIMLKEIKIEQDFIIKH